MLLRKNLSFFTLLLLILILWIWRFLNIIPNELSWDVLGYYLYLPSTFVHNDFFLSNYEWLKVEAENRMLADNLYMVSSAPNGKAMYFFLMGMAFLYFPFFIIAHLLAPVLGYNADGFSEPYLYAMVICGLVYTSLAAILLRKVLLYFFSDRTTAFLLVFLVFATNAIHHLSIKNLETVNFLFFFVTLMLYLTIKWHENPSRKFLVFIFLTGAITTLIKPSEVFIFLIPLLWNIKSWDGLKAKIKVLFSCYRNDLLFAILAAFLLCLPQMLYWFYMTGSPIYDSYKNPGIGIDWWNPHIIQALFSFRKGWFIYTPAAVFFIVGLYFLWKKNRLIAWSLTGYFVVSFYIMVSWTEWWYGAGYSFRPVVSLYPILLIGLGYLYEEIQKFKIVHILFGILITLLMALNVFQYYQFSKQIIHPYRTTFAYYKKVFLKCDIPKNANELLLIDRSFKNEIIIPANFPEAYDSLVWKNTLEPQLYKADEFMLEMQQPFKSFTSQDHLFVKWSAKVFYDNSDSGIMPLLISTMDRNGGGYGYTSNPLLSDSLVLNEFLYLSPELRSKNDPVKLYIWNKPMVDIQISDLKVIVYFPKN